MSVENISNREQAKMYFFSMGCNHFHLIRESEERAKEYYALKISSDVEAQWRKEYFNDLINDLLIAEPKEMGHKFYGLKHTVDRDQYYIKEMEIALKSIYQKIPASQIGFMLISIIGNNSTDSHEGLIEMAYRLKLNKSALEFYNYAKYYLEIAKSNKISTVFFKNNLVDVVRFFKIKEDNQYIQQLIEEDNHDGFNYYLEGAQEGNIFSMLKLADYYLEGRGCIQNKDQAIVWLKVAINNGNELAKEKLEKLCNSI